nr:DUF4232 domain-containing protein [Streptomyces sp. SID685]
MTGFAGVDMVGAQKTDGTWSLARSAKKPPKATLQQGDTVDFGITLLPVAKSTAPKEKFVPARFLVTPPNETTHFTLKWPFGGQILKQDGPPTRAPTSTPSGCNQQ